MNPAEDFHKLVEGYPESLIYVKQVRGNAIKY